MVPLRLRAPDRPRRRDGSDSGGGHSESLFPAGNKVGGVGARRASCAEDYGESQGVVCCAEEKAAPTQGLAGRRERQGGAGKARRLRARNRWEPQLRRVSATTWPTHRGSAGEGRGENVRGEPAVPCLYARRKLQAQRFKRVTCLASGPRC